MVLQGAPGEDPTWAVPSGGREAGETYQDCCVREVWEETGYRVRVLREAFVKRGLSFGMEVEVHYYEVTLHGGAPTVQDPDGLIHEIAWKSPEDVGRLPLSFPEDRELLLTYLSGSS